MRSPILLTGAFLIGAVSVRGGCDLSIMQSGPCLGDAAFGTPKVGDIYGLKIIVAASGSPAAPFRIKWTIANRTIYFDNINIGPGSGYWWWMTQWMSLDGPIPWSVTLDPENVSGDTNLTNNTVNGVFEPALPAIAVETYGARNLHGVLSSTAKFRPGSGTIPLFSKLFGVPSSHGTQQATSVDLPEGGKLIATQPNNMPACEVLRTNAPAGTYTDKIGFRLMASNMRVNPVFLRSATWKALGAEGTEWTRWVEPDAVCQSTAPQVAEFVARSLPANYRTSMTPYDASRKLHCAVAKELNYLTPPPAGDAVGVLQQKKADCGGFSALLVAALRHIGVPSRRIGGFWQGSSGWHVRVEFHLPGHEWIVADPTATDAEDTEGNYAYFFGQVFDGNRFAAMDAGDRHVRDYFTFGCLQVPNWYWNGGAEFISYDGFSRLQPMSTLRVAPIADNQVRIELEDVPTEGSIAVETSMDLKTWRDAATATADGTNKTLMLPKTGASAFYRARLVLP